MAFDYINISLPLHILWDNESQTRVIWTNTGASKTKTSICITNERTILIFIS